MQDGEFERRMRAALAIIAAASIVTSGAQFVTERMLWALGQIETGANGSRQQAADRAVGAAGEVSRYQIQTNLLTPAERKRSADPTAMKTAARRILEKRVALYVSRHGKEPNLVGIYEIWNSPARPLGWKPGPTPPAIFERAQRFANLAEMP